MRGWWLLAVGLASAAVGGEEGVSSAAETALRRALISSAQWTMERNLGESGKILRSSGTVDCVAQSGIVWRVTAPFDFTVAMTTDAMIIRDEDGERVKKLEELPHYAEIRRRTDRFVAGDREAFDGLFELKSEMLADGGWRLKLEPSVAAMKLLVRSIEISGNRLPTQAVLENADGGRSIIRFRERVNVR